MITFLGCLNLFVRLNRIFDHFQYSVFKVQTMITNVIIQTIIIDCLGLSGLEPPTSRLSGVRSNRLSYKPSSSPRNRFRGGPVTVESFDFCPHIVFSRGPRYFGASDYDIYLNGLSRFIQKSGNLLLSHIVSNIVPSAARVLTIVFGMRTGVSLWRIVT